MVEEKGTECKGKVQVQGKGQVKGVDGGRQYGVQGEIWVERGERWHRRTEERKDIAGGAVERYREGKRERGDNSKQQAHERGFCARRPTNQLFFYDNICFNANIFFYDV